MSYAADSGVCLDRILASTDLSGLSKKDATTFTRRLKEHFPRLFDKYTYVYGHQYDCYFHLQKLVEILRDGLKSRKPALKKLDNERLKMVQPLPPPMLQTSSTLREALFKSALDLIIGD